MPQSPLENSDGPLRVVISCDGADLQDAAVLIRVTVRRAVDKVPVATLVFADGDMPEHRFPLSDSATLKPGTEVTVTAGYGDDAAAIFSGIVVKHGLTIGGANDSRLVLECHDKTIRMTVGRRNARYEEQTDADILEALVSGHGLAASISGATVHHAQLVQHYCSDWDFLLARAEANGCLVIVTDGEVAVAEPSTSGAAVLKVTYGEDLIEFEAELDARDQYAEVQARAWDATTQTLLESTAAGPVRLNPQGNLDSATLSRVLGVGTVNLQTGAALPKAALDAWARAQQLKSGLSRLRGRMRFQGSAKATLGGLFDLAGVGERFTGPVLATGVTHHIEQGAWSTEVEFGRPVEWFTERPEMVAPPAAGWVPGIEGLHVGVVVKLDADPACEHRVQVRLPAAGVDVRGDRLVVNAQQQTNVPHIYAAGDVCGPYEIVHLAIQQAEVAMRNVLRTLREPAATLETMDYRLKLFVLFTRPEVAQVGLTEAEARAAGEDFRVASYPFNDHGKSLVMGETDGFVKLLTRARTGEIIGAAVIGPEAASLIHEITVAMHYHGTAQTLAAIPHYHPTLSEIWTYPAEELA